MGVIPNPKMAFIFPISCILSLIFQILLKYFPKCEGKGSFPKSQINSLTQFKYQLKIGNTIYLKLIFVSSMQTLEKTLKPDPLDGMFIVEIKTESIYTGTEGPFIQSSRYFRLYVTMLKSTVNVLRK